MSDSAESVSSTFTTIVVVAVVVPLAIAVIGLIAVFAYKRERERNFVPPSLANMPGMTNVNLPMTTPSLPVQVRHVRNVRNDTLLEWPAPSPGASQQVQGTPDGTSNAVPDPLLHSSEARRNVPPQLLPTPYNMTYSAAQPSYSGQPAYPPGFPPYSQVPHTSSSTPAQIPPFPTQPTFGTATQPHAPLFGPAGAALPNTHLPRAVHPRVLMLANDDASRSTSPSQATDDSSTLRGPRSMGSTSTMGEPVPQYELFDSAVLTEEPQSIVDSQRARRQDTNSPPIYSPTNPFRRLATAAQ
ncbi:hypothetical protein K466DRAFT_662844 [Polyporus arcularius HHB13444]|uniref:Uncharacterized protein n=1 Tax=Polyporus arcularius HHB13444 TaxID=1314778 RepID=A0A5C3PF32_9APHY|nr:hypothetical protein K466DRAFT_662844 [Polyporus arcularius HHB13444]